MWVFITYFKLEVLQSEADIVMHKDKLRSTWDGEGINVKKKQISAIQTKTLQRPRKEKNTKILKKLFTSLTGVSNIQNQ